MLYRTFLLMFVAGILTTSSWAQVVGETSKKDASRDEPVEVTADQLEADDNSGRMVFSGNAVARQGDVTIYAERLLIFYTDSGQDVERIEAEQDVRIEQGERLATGQKAVFFRLENRLVLTGEPVVTDGENRVSGEEITVFLDDQKSIVKGGKSGRVNAVFKPKSEDRP